MRTWVEVDLGALARNLQRVRARRPTLDLIAVIKADAYGHGAVPVARALETAGAAMLGVGDSREALELIQAGIKLPLLILGAIIDGEAEAVVAHGIRTTIHSFDRAASLEAEAARQGRVHPVHLKVDTGMSRLGLMPERALEVADFVHWSPHLFLEGLSTHMATSRLDRHEESNRQLALFEDVHRRLTEHVGPIPWVHCRNSAAAWNPRVEESVSTALRVGASLYGIPGPGDVATPFEPAMSLRSQILFMKDVPAGTPVGYDGRYVTPAPTRLAVLPVGYHDGLPAAASPDGFVLIHGRPAPIRGSVSMDYTTVDVTHIPGCRTGDIALVFGRDPMGEAPLKTLAEKARSSPYAVTCGIGRRVHRVYLPPRPALRVHNDCSGRAARGGSTEDGYHWGSAACFADFKGEFE